MNWELGAMVSFNGRAYFITAIVVDQEEKRTRYTLNNVDRRYEFLTVYKPI